MEKEKTTQSLYKEDVAKLNLIMRRGEIFADRFHEMIENIVIPENEI